MTGTEKRKWWGICKDLASAMNRDKQAMMQTSQDGGQIDASFWTWWCLRWKSCPSNTEEQLYLIVLWSRVNERTQRAVHGRRNGERETSNDRKGSVKKYLRRCFVELCLHDEARGRGREPFWSIPVACRHGGVSQFHTSALNTSYFDRIRVWRAFWGKYSALFTR